MEHRSDADLVQLVRAGEKEAFGPLVTRYQGHVYGLAYSIVENWAEAQDIAQETFLRAYLNLDQLQDPARFPAWLRRVAFSIALNWVRAYRPALFRQLDGHVDLETLEIPDFRPGPEEELERRELAHAVLQAVASLPSKYRLPLTMFHLDGLSYQKVADFLDIPLGTAKALIHRARAKLKLALASYVAEEMTPMVQEVFDEHKLPAEFASKVLERVPRLGWGRGRECTFLGALEAALTATEHPYSYTDMMGWSGMAFRTRWFAGNDSGAKWCPSSPVGEMDEEIAATARATGWDLQVAFVDPKEEAGVERLTARIVAAVDAGRPVLAYEPRLNMDVVFGYEERGKVLLLRDYFQPDEPLRLPTSGLGFMLIFLGEHGEALPARDAARQALEIASRNWRRETFSEGPGAYWYGEAALVRWAGDIAGAASYTDEERGFLRFVGWWNYSSLYDARRAAVSFLRETAATALPGAREALFAAAEAYQQEVAFLDAAAAETGAPFTTDGPWTEEQQRREVEVLRELQAREAQAIERIEETVGAP